MTKEYLKNGAFNMDEILNINIKSDKKRVTVNDDGDYIEIDYKNQAFTKSFLDFAKLLQNIQVEYSAQIDTVLGDEKTSELEKTKAVFDIQTEIINTLKSKIDNIIGENTCAKVFKGFEPGIPEIVDFINQLSNIISKLNAERFKVKTSKYTSKYHK